MHLIYSVMKFYQVITYLMKVEEERKKAGLKLNIQKTKILASWHQVP